MGDIKNIVNKPEIESETPKKDEDNSQNSNSRAKSLRSGVNDMQKKRTADISESSSSTLSIPNKNLLTVCKPISVKLIRLPDTVVNKCIQAAEERAKKRKKIMWKVGLCYMDKKRKIKKMQKLRREKSTLLQWLQSGKTNVEKPKLEEIVVGAISKISESAKIEELPSKKFELPKQSIEAEENAIHKSAECTKNIETNTEIPTQSELPDSESQITAKNCEIFLNKPEQRNFPEISDNIELRLATKIPHDLSNVVVDTTQILSESSPVVSSEANNNQNRKISLKRLLEQNNSITTQLVEMQKRMLQFDDKTDGLQNYPSKKYKSAKSTDLSEEINTTNEKNISESLKSSSSIVKKFTINKLNRADPKSVRRRSIETEKIITKEVQVGLCKLENSQEPLVLEWTRKNSLVHSNNIISSESRTSPIKNRAAIEESSKIGTVIDDVPITSLKDFSGNSDVNKRLNGPEESDTDVLSEKHTSTSLEAATVEPITAEETSKHEEEEDDDEIVRFLHRNKKVRPSIDSSSSAGSSSSQTLVSTRVLRSKTPTINKSLIEKMVEFPVTMKTPGLRIRERSISSDSSDSETINNHIENSQSLCQEPTNISVLHENQSRRATTSRISESSGSYQELRRPPSSRRKVFQFAKDDKIVNDAELFSVFLSNEKTAVTASTNCVNSANQANALNVEENEAEITNESSNNEVGTTSNFVTCEQNQEDEVVLDSLTEVNYHVSEIQNANSKSCNEVLVARRKLTALKNAMVVLTRLEDLDGLSEENRYSVDDIEFNAAGDFEFSRSSTPDPLAINKNDNQHSLRETENNLVPSSTGDVRLSPRKSLRSDVAAIAYTQNIEESPESDVEMHLGLEDACSQETIESDVEMTLVFEENSSQETEQSDAEFSRSTDVNQTRLASRDNDESPVVVLLDKGKAVESHDDEPTNSVQSSSIKSAQNLPDGILTDARSNSGDSRKIPNDYEGLDEHCKRCSCEEHKNDKRRLNCQNIPGLYKCVTCRIIFKDAATLEAHKTSDAVCSSGFICNICQTTYSTHNALTIHRISCVNKVSQKQSSVDDSTNVQETAEPENPLAVNADSLAIKANPKNENYQKVLSRRMRAKSRGPIDNLKCGVCSITFGTTQTLSEHIFKHNTEELQQAYKNAKAKALEDSKTSKTALANQKENPLTEQIASTIVTVEADKDLSLPQQSSAETIPLIAATVANKDTNAKSATVCLCHRDKHPACPDKTDLQIEMVLLCQYCTVIFRRRECFEIHYRTSPQCATDRSRGRSPKLYCANCQSILNSWAGMRRHLEVHASLNVEGTVRFVCNICRVIFVGFGALFYNHWSSHLKDTMFVASRYSFPKNSVQPIDGIPKLPIGATSEESYILVAEHVCSNCKKPFSTRRDLEMHEKSKCCVETNEGVAVEKQWHCDVCNLSFDTRRGLNKHSQTQHAQRFLCVATTPLAPTFMCTRCFAIKKLVADIENHWKTALQHNMPLNFIENVAYTKKTPDTSEASNNANGSTNENQIAEKTTSNTFVNETEVINSGDKSKNNNVQTLIDISDSIEPEITCVFQSPTKTAGIQAACVNNRESQMALTNSSGSSATVANSSSILQNLLDLPLMSNKDKTAMPRVLENPCADIVLSDVSTANVTDKLVINESRTNSANDSNSCTNVDSYKTVIAPKASSDIEKEQTATKTTVSAKEANNENSTGNTSDATIVTANKPKQSEKQDSHGETSLNCDVSAKTTDTEIGTENGKSTEIAGTKKSNSEITTWPKQKLSEVRSARAKLSAAKLNVPEVIDLSDEEEEVETTSTTPGDKLKPPSVITKNNVKKMTDNKSESTESNKSASISKPAVKANSFNDFQASNQVLFPFVLNTAEKSFEEVRFDDYTRSKKLVSNDSAGVKKPGFLRVKNLSELQAIKIHNCLNCNIVFETPTALEDHHRNRLCASLEKQPNNPEEMSGAVILPNNSNATSEQSLSTVCEARNVVTQQLVGLNSRLGAISEVPVSSVIINNETSGSWISVEGQHDVISSVALVNTTHSLMGGTHIMNLESQQSTNDNLNAIMTTSVATTTASIAQTQDIIAVQQKQQQQQQQYQQLQQQPQYQQLQQQQQYQQLQQQPQYQQLQPQPQYQQLQPQSQYQQLQQQPQYQQQQQVHYQQQQQYQQHSIFGINQQITNNCNGQIGFHVMPAMVLPQTAQINKQQCNDGALRNTSIANLPINGQINNVPFTYHSNKPNRYLCSICSTYSCNSIGTMNTHVMKHYTGFNNSTNQNTTQLTAGANSNVGFQNAKDKTPPNVTVRTKAQESNSIGNSMKDNVFLKNTPQGLVWVTSVSTQMTNQQAGSSAGQDNSQINSGRTIIRGGQLVYRCLICKCAMYKTYPPLRNHIVIVHGITDLISAGMDNIVQKMYLCTHCPHGAAMYDSEESHRQHVDSCHSIVCLNCGRAFATHHNLKMHMTSCSGANRDTNNASDKNC